MQSIKAICSLLLLVTSFTVKGQPYYLKHFQVENGLSNNSITCCLQDKLGFMWFGTKDGLNRFDGYAFKIFRKTDGKPNSIGSNFIHCLYEDPKGTIWVGTERGLYEYLNKTESFRLLPATAHMYIDQIATDTLGNFWFISYYQLYRYDKQIHKLENYNPQQYFVATHFAITREGTLLVGTSDGQIKKYDPQTDSFSGFDLFSHSKPGAHKWIESLAITDSGNIIAGTSDTEIKITDPSLSTYTDLTISGTRQSNLYIRSVLQTAGDELWLGTESGIFIYNLKTAGCVHLEKDVDDPYSITDNAVYSLCKDREGGIWIGTYFGGINYLPPPITPFTKYFSRENENSLSGNVVGEIKQDDNGNLWIGTLDAGLNKYDPATGRFTRFEPGRGPGSIAFFSIQCLLVTGNKLWIGTFQHGLDLMDIRTGKVTRHYEAGRDGFTHDFVSNIYQVDSGQLLISTPDGPFLYNAQKDRFARMAGLSPGIWYNTLLKDEKGVVWGGSFGNGLYAYSARNGKTETYVHDEKDSNSLSNNRVTCIFEDSHHDIWVATEDGLCRFNREKDNFIRYGTRNGFPSDFFLSILEGDRHNLWISTTKGLVRFQPDSGKIKVFDRSNGLISEQFNYNSAFKAPDGRMYFGTAKGLVGFNPKELRQNDYRSPIYITGFQINGQDIDIDSGDAPLKRSILYTDKITLAYNQSTIGIDFAALNYISPETMRYLYKMDGLSDKWITQKNDRRVDFIELPPGSYVFRVKAVNSDGVWSKESRLSIRVLPPWWSDAPAWTFYIIGMALLAFSIIYYYDRKMKEKNKRKIEMLKIAKERELLEAKIEFFTNVAHEIKTPLTLIKVPLSKIIKKTGGHSEFEKSLHIMNRNTARLIELTNQLLDFRQTEINRYQIFLERTNISELVSEVCAGFESLAEDRNIKLSLHLPEATVHAPVDVDAFTKIIYNLFGNAIKYADTRVSISLRPGLKTAGSFTIEVKNDGYLIPDEFRDRIFEPFYRIRKTETPTGSGIGLALALSLAHLHNGTLILEPPANGMNVFSLTLPIHGEPDLNS